ncbi:MAG: hypothetical protein A3H69_04085 [Candidatus Sungbacteria bacterium RIFCSPLOWO2_02_FULL_47_9]|uniref:Uncharacterized protein n=1 Tax=Candidatus Sungbacteria bacterium RIFCSPHIGHO2_01_FULL_47_32 TaxID=1802264 RepID=A0A1G2K378_9BACT|nr:MAG: hypothetical protein UX72_C0015G0020 [Parcubacteria group bacterium GW2011_GWA2_47_10]OGZ93874.1 MAG: hypothetical protein A2633_05150 [Candidatus Sungbacteria bacterium RIFCSPHIGHO2_01_FULL_47_32]OGZ99126.1 MAG: hypothetical protein A3D57_05200 [Candidatus Sungbacteria bacterium RIFCSPHIGHO2_02_FULL_46_12]OHA06002.1 MAG: hypothetical protein A3A28_05210 [Candidatus Sungbacteria bacterium RIFCSPLOWO2_01_FULL_47_32]OHA10057.1 MAG: hypothetical protein A3H69_04085 [Candidatus Sungbacteria
MGSALAFFLSGLIYSLLTALLILETLASPPTSVFSFIIAMWVSGFLVLMTLTMFSFAFYSASQKSRSHG